MLLAMVSKTRKYNYNRVFIATYPSPLKWKSSRLQLNLHYYFILKTDLWSSENRECIQSYQISDYCTHIEVLILFNISPKVMEKMYGKIHTQTIAHNRLEVSEFLEAESIGRKFITSIPVKELIKDKNMTEKKSGSLMKIPWIEVENINMMKR